MVVLSSTALSSEHLVQVDLWESGWKSLLGSKELDLAYFVPSDTDLSEKHGVGWDG